MVTDNCDMILLQRVVFSNVFFHDCVYKMQKAVIVMSHSKAYNARILKKGWYAKTK